MTLRVADCLPILAETVLAHRGDVLALLKEMGQSRAAITDYSRKIRTAHGDLSLRIDRRTAMPMLDLLEGVPAVTLTSDALIAVIEEIPDTVATAMAGMRLGDALGLDHPLIARMADLRIAAVTRGQMPIMDFGQGVTVRSLTIGLDCALVPVPLCY